MTLLGFDSPRIALRTRLVAIFAVVFVASTALVLVVSYALVSGQLRSTLPPDAVDPILGKLAWQYVLALVGIALVAIGLGWLAARRLLAPIQALTRAAQRASGDHLDERLALGGPHDELRELGDTFDAMLDRFQESIEAQRRFIANASHELRSPLTAIRTEVDVTLTDPDATVAELRAMGERVIESGDQLDELLAALMVLARSQRGLLGTAPVDVATIATLAAGDLRDAARTARVDLTCEVEPAPLLGDPALLRRLVANLIDNAIRYNRPGGTVAVSVHPVPGAAVVRVVNTGMLIPANDLERLRQPFERLGRHGDGSGLGLSIVQAVAEAHGGAVRLLALDEGGLDVTVTLPAEASTTAPAQRGPGATTAAGAGAGDRVKGDENRRVLPDHLAKHR